MDTNKRGFVVRLLVGLRLRRRRLSHEEIIKRFEQTSRDMRKMALIIGKAALTFQEAMKIFGKAAIAISNATKKKDGKL